MGWPKILMVLFLVAFPIIAYFKKANRGNLDEYALNRRELKWPFVAAGLSMTFAGGAATVNMASLGYTFGWWPLIDPFATMLALVFGATFLASRIRSGSGFTIADSLSGANDSLKVVLGIITFFVYVLITSAQAVAAAKLAAPILGISVPIATFAVCIAVFTYIYLGGMRAVTITDIVQLLIVVALFAVPISWIAISRGFDSHLSGNAVPMPSNLIVFMAFPLLFVSVSQDLNLRIRSAASIHDARLGAIVGGILYATIIVCAVFAGRLLAAHGTPLDDPEMALTTFFHTFTPGLNGVAQLAIAAAIVSSFDSFAFSATIGLCSDIFPRMSLLSKADDSVRIRLALLAVSTLTLVISLLFQQVLTLILAALLIYVSVHIPVAIGRRLRVQNRILLGTTVATVSSIILVELTIGDFPMKPLILPSAHICLVIIASVFTPKSHDNQSRSGDTRE